MILSKFTVFSQLSPVEQAKILVALEKMEFPAGYTLFRQGDFGDSMYLIDSGSVEIFTVESDGSRTSLSVLSEGDVFGEMSLLDRQPRSASAVTIRAAVVYRMDTDTFDRLISQYYGVAAYFLSLLSNRLSNANLALQESRSSNILLVFNNLNNLDLIWQRAILAAAYLPVCPAALLQVYLHSADFTTDEAQRQEIPQSIAYWSVEKDCLVITEGSRKMMQAAFLKQYGEMEKKELLEVAADYYLATGQPIYAVQVYAEDGAWYDACAIIQNLGEEVAFGSSVRNRMLMFLAACPEAALFDYFDILLIFLEAALDMDPQLGLDKIELILKNKNEIMADSQKAGFYRMAADFCSKLGLQEKALQYLKLSAEKDSDGDAASDREYLLAKHNLDSAKGVAMAETAQRLNRSKNQLTTLAAIILSAIALWYFGTTETYFGLTRPAMIFLGITAAAVIFWIMETGPDYIIALLMLFLWVVCGVTTPERALSGFASPVWLYMLCIFGFGAAISESGLLFRISLYIIKLFPNSYTGQLLGLAAGGMLVNPLIPSAMTKVSLASPLAKSLSEAMGFAPRSKGSAGLGLSALIFYGYLTPFLLTGSSANVYALGLIPGTTMVSWWSWMKYAFPAMLFFVLVMFAVIILLYKPRHAVRISDETVSAQLKILGQLTKQEVLSAVAAVILVLLLGFQSYLRLDSTWIMLLVFAGLVIGGAIDNNTVKNGINWPFMIFMGAILGFVEVSSDLGLVKAMTAILTVYMKPLMASPYIFLLVAVATGFILSSIVRYEPALVFMVTALVPIAQAAGINSWVTVFVALLTINPFFFSFLSSTYLTAYYAAEEKSFDHKQGQQLSLFFAVVTLLAVMVSVPYWQYMGLIK